MTTEKYGEVRGGAGPRDSKTNLRNRVKGTFLETNFVISMTCTEFCYSFRTLQTAFARHFLRDRELDRHNNNLDRFKMFSNSQDKNDSARLKAAAAKATVLRSWVRVT